MLSAALCHTVASPKVSQSFWDTPYDDGKCVDIYQCIKLTSFLLKLFNCAACHVTLTEADFFFSRSCVHNRIIMR